MFGLIERYIENMNINDLNNLAIGKEIYLSSDELEFSYNFIKKNWKTVLGNVYFFDIEKYKNKFSEENFSKIKKLANEGITKYGNYLKK